MTWVEKAKAIDEVLREWGLSEYDAHVLACKITNLKPGATELQKFLISFGKTTASQKALREYLRTK